MKTKSRNIQTRSKRARKANRNRSASNKAVTHASSAKISAGSARVKRAAPSKALARAASKRKVASATPRRDHRVWLNKALEREEGVTRAEVMQHCELKYRQSVNKQLKALAQEHGRTVERFEGVDNAGKKDMRYRWEPQVPASIDLPLEHAVPSITVLRQFSEQMLGAAGAGPRSFAKRLQAGLSDDVRRQMDHLASRVSLEFNPTRQGCPHAFSVLLQAIACSRTVLVDYERSDDAAQRVAREAAAVASTGMAARIERAAAREVEVHGLFFRRRALYAIVRDVGWKNKRQHRNAPNDLNHPALRTFRLSRIREVKMTSMAFQPIPRFAVNDYLADAFEIVRKPLEPLTTATIRINPEFGVRIADTTWHHSQTVTVEPDGTHVLCVSVRGFDELRFWIAWMGEGAEIVSPPEWREQMKAMIGAMRARYE